MTTRVEAAEALAQRFASVWGATYPFTLENEDFDPPDGPWARFAVRHQVSRQSTLGPSGARKFARRGSAYVQVFGPTGQGTKAVRTLAQTVADGFEGTTLAGTTLHIQAVTARETSPDGRWFQMIVEIPFTYYETR